MSDIVEEQADEILVEEAYKELSDIVVRRWSQAMEEVGEYLISKFYNDDLESVKNNKPANEKSLYQLIQKIQGDRDNAPSKSWIYNAINLAADKKQFELENYSKYNELGLSHKVSLTHVKDITKKKELIEEAIENSYSVEKLKERINENKGKRDTIKLDSLPNKRQLKKMPLTRLEKLRDRATKRADTLDKKKKTISDEVQNIRNNQKKLDEVINEMKSNSETQ